MHDQAHTVTTVFTGLVVVSGEVGGRCVARAIVVALAIVVVVPLVVVRLEPAGILGLGLRKAGLLRVGLVVERVSRVGLAVTWASRHLLEKRKTLASLSGWFE